jgi:hypothetical protein
MFTVATPVVTTVEIEKDGATVQVARDFSPLAVAFVALQALAAVLSLIAAVLAWKKRSSAAKKILIVAGIVGLIPAVIPGISALLANYCVGKLSDEGV